MTTQNSQLPRALSTWIEQWITRQGIQRRLVFIEPLAGDGSTRCFYRLTLPTETRVLLHDPTWVSSSNYAAHQIYLHNMGIRVPKFYETDPQSGCIVMQDCGNELLQHRVESAAPDEKESWLLRGIEVLARFHAKAGSPPTTVPGTKQSLDEKKFFEELCFTQTHLIENFFELGPWSGATQEAVRRFCTEAAALLPKVFCHRDYHTRNLLLHEDELYLVDFQDARLGPLHYDLASYVFDSYVEIPDTMRLRLMQAYLNGLQGTPLASQLNPETFFKEVELIAVQRLLKAAGSFASFYTRYGKKTHLDFLSPCFAMVRSLLKKNPALAGTLKDWAALDTWQEKIDRMESDQWKTLAKR